MFRIIKAVGWVLVALVATGAVLFAFGMRVTVLGGGSLRVGFPRSSDAQAAEIERHRAAQRAASPAAAPGVPATASSPASAGTAAPPPAAPVTPVVTPAPGPAASDPSTDWTDFRGPRRDGHYRGMPIVTTWPAGGLAPIWKQPIGGGYASFVIARGRAFTIEQRRDREVVAAYDPATGRELWTYGWTAEFREPMGGPGPRATPTWHDGLVFALGGTGELVCLDEATGARRWRVNILENNGAENLEWGMAASPLVVDETVIVLPGGPRGRSIAAYHRRTGARVWSAHDDKATYASPMLVTVAGMRQILLMTAARVMGVAPDTGARLWDHPWTTQYDVNAAQPLVIGDNRVFVSSGYGTGAAVLEITGRGDRFEAREIWRNIRMKNQFNSSVLLDGFIYGLDEGILACVDAATGDLKWKGGRYGYGQVLLASGHLIVLAENGDLALVRATPERHDERLRFPALEGKTWNNMAMSGGLLLVRNAQQMAGYDLRVK